MAPAGESDESGEDETGDFLSAAYAALRRRGRRGTGERAEAGVVVQLCRSPWVSRLWMSLSSSATSSCSPRSLTRMRLRFSSSPECGTYLLCCGDVYAQSNLCRRRGIPRYWYSSGELSTSPSFCNDRRRGVFSAAALEFHSCGAQAVGAAAWERKAVCSCFEIGCRSSSHR